MAIRNAVEVNLAGTEGKRHGLPWEVSTSVWTSQTTATATVREGCREVSRGHSSRREPTKGRTFCGKEQTGILDGGGATARHVDPVGRACAPARAAKAELDLLRLRSGKHPRR